MRHGTERPQRDLATRTQLFEAVLRHRAAGEPYNQIIRSVEGEFHVKLSKSHVGNWVRGDHVPDGSVRKFVPTPTPELGYVIGVMLGDGSMSVCGDHNYRLKLRVTDRDFAQAFAGAIATVLNRPVPPVRYHAKTDSWHVDVSSLLPKRFLKKPVKELGSFIEHSEQCIRGFLRGFFDSEGGVSGGALNASNTDTTLILLVLSLLQAIGIQTPGPYLGSKGNRFVTIKGQVHRANADCLVVRVRNCSRQVFLERVGFNIKRKRDRLILALGTKKT